METANIILLLTPAIMWGVTEIVQKVLPKIQGVWTLLEIPVASLALNYALKFVGVDEPLFIQIVAGCAAVFIDQILKVIKGA